MVVGDRLRSKKWLCKVIRELFRSDVLYIRYMHGC